MKRKKTPEHLRLVSPTLSRLLSALHLLKQRHGVVKRARANATHNEAVWHSCTRRPSRFHTVSKKKHCCNGKLWKAYMKSNWPCSGFYSTHKREYKWAITSVGREVVFSPSKTQKMTLVHSVAPPCSSLYAKKKYCCITVSLKEIKKITLCVSCVSPRSKIDKEQRKRNVWHLIQWIAFFLSHLVSPFNRNPC